MPADLTTVLNLEQEVKRLKSEKLSLENECEKVRESITKLGREHKKEMSAVKAETDNFVATKEKEIAATAKGLAKKEKTIEKRLEESEVIAGQMKKLSDTAKAIADEKKNVDQLKASCLEREKLANLKIKQYEEKIKELNG